MFFRLYAILPVVMLLFICPPAWSAESVNRDCSSSSCFAGSVNQNIPQDMTEFNTDHINDVMSRAKEMQEKLVIPNNPNKDLGEAKARESYEFYKSNEFQDTLKAEMDRLQKALMGGEPGQQPYYADTLVPLKRLLSYEHIYIFISSSMPTSTIRNYVQDVARLNDPNVVFVMRGFINGMKKIKPTMDFVRNIIQKQPGCTGKCDVYNVSVQINPILYSRYNVDRVPAILYVQGNVIQQSGIVDNASYPYWLAYGDASLDTVTEIFADKSGSESMKAVNKKLKSID